MASLPEQQQQQQQQDQEEEEEEEEEEEDEEEQQPSQSQSQLPETSEIKRLDDNTIRRITAEQAISDLSSIVKELIDNALDAESTTIKSKLSLSLFQKEEYFHKATRSSVHTSSFNLI